MKDTKYTYNPATNEYTFSAASLANLCYRCTTPKEKIEIEDAKENAKRIEKTRPR